MAYTRIEPLPVVENPLLGIASGALSYIREVNEIKRKENEKRQDDIIKLLRDVDFPTALEMVNKKKQLEIYKSAENALMKSLTKSAKSNGAVSIQDRVEEERIINTLQQELYGIKQGEEMYKNKMGEIAKTPGLYTPESARKLTDLMVSTGDYRDDILEYTPIPFSVVENSLYTMFDKGTTAKTSIENGREITRDIINMPDEEKKANYEAIRNKMPGVANYEIKSFMELKEKDSATYNKYKQEGIDMQSAAQMWARNEVAPKLGTGRITGDEPYEPKKSTEDKIQDVKGIQMENGEIAYKFEPIPVTDEVKVYKNGKLENKVFKGASAVQVSYGKLPDGTTGKYVKMIANETGIQGSGQNARPVTQTKSYIVPYDQLSSKIKRKVNLIGIDEFEKNKTVYKGVPKGGF